MHDDVPPSVTAVCSCVSVGSTHYSRVRGVRQVISKLLKFLPTLPAEDQPRPSFVKHTCTFCIDRFKKQVQTQDVEITVEP